MFNFFYNLTIREQQQLVKNTEKSVCTPGSYPILSLSLLELMWCLFGPKLPDHFFTCFFFSGKSLEERRLHRGIALLKGYCHLDKNTFFRPLCLPFLKPFGFHLEAAANPPRHHHHHTTRKNALVKAGSIYVYAAYIRVLYYLPPLSILHVAMMV